MAMKSNHPEVVGTRGKYRLSPEGRALLIARYDGRPSTIDYLCGELKVPRNILKDWACRLGLTRTSNMAWSEQELTYLERYLPTMSMEDLSRRLNRSIVSIRWKCRDLGISKAFTEGYTRNSLSLALGASCHTIDKWIEKGWLRARPRKTQCAHDHWYISDAAVRDFVFNYPHLIDPARANWLWLIDVLKGENGLGSLADERGSFKDAELEAELEQRKQAS
jgi:hypothetical protein